MNKLEEKQPFISSLLKTYEHEINLAKFNKKNNILPQYLTFWDLVV